MSAPTAREALRLGDPQEFILPRDDDRDLKFTGWRLASQGDTWWNEDRGTNSTTEIEIYATAGGRLITRVVRFGLSECTAQGGYVPIPSPEVLRQIETDPSSDLTVVRVDETSMVEVHVDGDAALKALKEDGRYGALGRLSKAAWVEACDMWPALGGQDVETIE